MAVAASRRPKNDTEQEYQSLTSQRKPISRADPKDPQQERKTQELSGKGQASRDGYFAPNQGETNHSDNLSKRVQAVLHKLRTNQLKKVSPFAPSTSETGDDQKVIHLPRRISKNLPQSPYVREDQQGEIADVAFTNQSLTLFSKGNLVKFLFLAVIPVSILSFLIGARLAFVILAHPKLTIPELMWRSINLF